MKPSYIKFSDERNKKYSIKTIIGKQGNETYVIKEPIFSEGIEHIDNIVRYFDLLKKYYDNVEICPVRKEENRLFFDFIEGKSLLDCYQECMEKKDVKKYEELLLFHKVCVLGSKENECIFQNTPESEELFGSLAFLDRAAGIQVANFDATASNIVMCGEQPVFIDYEWVCEFPIPQELAIYHCIRDSYLHLSELEEFYPLQNAMEFLNVKSEMKELEKAYVTFFKSVIREKDGSSFAEEKITCLKGKRSIKEYIEDNKYAHEEWEKCANNWKASSQEGDKLKEENKKIRQEWEKCANNWEQSSKEGDKLKEENKKIRQEWEKCANNWEQSCKENEQLQEEIQVCNQKYNELKREYDAVVNSRGWKIVSHLFNGKK